MWGATNTLIRRGVLEAELRKHSALQRQLQRAVGQEWAALLCCPRFVVPQLLNWVASALLVVSLAGSKLHVAMPVANAVSVACTAATGKLWMRDQMALAPLCAGIAFVSVGVALTAG